MDKLILNLESYLREILDLSVKPYSWPDSDSLPFFLRDSYEFYQTDILSLPVLLMVSRHESEQTPAAIKKHIQQVQKKWAGEVIYVSRQIHSYNRKRLIDYKVSFIIPGNQMYLPLLGLDLREHFRKLRGESRHISPSTQAIVIYALMNGTERSFTSMELAGLLGYSPMTIIRAFDEIDLNNLGSFSTKGRTRVLHFGMTKKELWDKALSLMRSPVKKRAWIDYAGKDQLRIQAGLTALAHYSMLAGPLRPVFAMSSANWNDCRRNNKIKELPASEINSYELEIWHYDPGLVAGIGVVDPFSLYLSLRDDTDDRVVSSLNKMMENVQW